jgi:CubicO group peptidase (beta-lactamase class C family)
MTYQEEVTRRYERMARITQAAARVPALQVALHRGDRPLWTFQVGDSGTARPLDAATQFRYGSVTKTFTAVLVMQCRDDGLLDLDDRIGAHIDLPAHGDLTIRRLLSHTSGIQREPHGDVWDTLQAPDLDQLLADLDKTERVLPTGRRFHYSNLGVGLLGYLVGQLRGGTWAQALVERLCQPLGLTSITVAPTPTAALGYMVDAYSDHAHVEAPVDASAIAPAAQLWGTAADLAKWAAFLADPATVDPAGAVLAGSTLDEMRWPITVTDEAVWSVGFGLGLILIPQSASKERIVHVGHDGAMPGFLAGAYGRRGGGAPKALGAAVLGSSGNGGGLLELPHQLLAEAVEHDPADVETWRIGSSAPAEFRSILGRWWSEGHEFIFFWRDVERPVSGQRDGQRPVTDQQDGQPVAGRGELCARNAADPATNPPAVFAPTDHADVLRTRSGREAGELLRLSRDPAGGEVIYMHWATYRLTRAQQAFDGVPVTRS